MEHFTAAEIVYRGDKINVRFVYSCTDNTTQTSNQGDIIQAAAVKRKMNQTNHIKLLKQPGDCISQQ